MVGYFIKYVEISDAREKDQMVKCTQLQKQLTVPKIILHLSKT